MKFMRMSFLKNLFRKEDVAGVSGNEAFSDAWLRSIISELTDAVVAYDENFAVLIFNRAAERIFGVAANEVIGQKITLASGGNPKLKLLTQVIYPSLAPSVAQVTESGVYPQIADIHFDDLHLRAVTNRITDAGGNIQGFVKVIRNRTREVEILRSKSDFITVAAHQLRTPLTAISWAFEGIKKDTALAVDTKEIADTGALAAQKLLKVVDDLLDVAKMEGGKYGYEFQETSLLAVIDEVLTNAREVAATYKVALYFDRPEDDVVLALDPQKLGLAIANLVDNGIKYNTPNGTVTVTVKRLAEPYVQVSVKDTGVGIPADAQSNVFTKFFRAENVMKFSTEGSGLGLYLVKNIIARHGGKIWVESELNRGTTFHFTLPTDPKLIPQKELIAEEN